MICYGAHAGFFVAYVDKLLESKFGADGKPLLRN
jgi:hypothetical protein